WQSHGVAQRRFELVWQDQPRSARLTCGHDGRLSLSLAGPGPDAKGGEVRELATPVSGPLLFSAEGAGLWVQWGDAPRTFSQLDWQGETAHLFTPQGATRITVLDPLAHAGEAAQEGGRLTAPMPGKVVSFAVKVGDKVKAGQALAVMEAMKMEHTISAPKGGTVAELLYAPGDQVADGAELLKLAV
ncbi:MAG: Acetyl-/propionyl-coenzyme carboxylase alpha chain, partial [Pseudomonadota bacterium]